MGQSGDPLDRSLRRVTDKYGKRNKFGTRKQGDGPVIRPPVPVASIGSKPRDRFAGDLPVTDHQRPVLDALRAGHTSSSAVARTLGRSPSSVVSTLYALADRGLVEHAGQQWRAVR